MQARVDWVLIIFGTQVIKKKRPVRPVFPDYLSVSYDYALIVFSSLRLNFSSLCYEKNHYFEKLKGQLYSLKKLSKILPLENSGDF